MLRSLWYSARYVSLVHEHKILKSPLTNVDVVRLTHDSDCHRHSQFIHRILDTTNARNHPDQILVFKILTHELSHDTQTSNLDLDVPVLNIVLHRRDQDSAATIWLVHDVLALAGPDL